MSTPDMSARDAEAMANAMLLDSPLPDIEKSDERVLEESGSDKLPEQGDSEKLPREATRSSMRRPLQLRLYHHVQENYLFSALSLIK